jgi:hypothetical protein
LFSISLALHFIIYNYIQIYRSQEKKIDASEKMLRLYQRKATVARVEKKQSPVSELQKMELLGAMVGG